MRALWLLASAAVAADNTFLLTNVNVHPVTAPEMANTSVLIKDGVVAEIAAKIKPPKGMTVIDAKGMRLYPGLINSGTRMGLDEINAVRETSDTNELGDFNPQLRSIIAVNPSSAHIPVTRANGITASITLPNGGMLAGQAALIHMDGWTWEEMAVTRSAAMHLRFPVLATRAPGRGGSDETRRIPYPEAKRKHDEDLAKLTQFFENARRYQRAKSSSGVEVKTDLKFEAMLPVLEGRLPVMITASREREIREALEFAQQQKIKIILAKVREVRGNLEKIKEHKVPVVLGETLALPIQEDDSYDSQFSLPGELQKAGVLFAFGTFDEAANFTDRNLPYNAAAAVPFGLPQDAALKALTINAARIWGVDDKIGSIEKGKWADLILTDGDPLETQTQILRMWIQGRAVSLESKHTLLYEKYRNRP